jgi:hypothetical protein
VASGSPCCTGPTIVPVLVTHDALTDIEPNLPDIGGHLACFNKHRAAIERAASTNYLRGKLEGDGVVLVQAGDLKA